MKIVKDFVIIPFDMERGDKIEDINKAKTKEAVIVVPIIEHISLVTKKPCLGKEGTVEYVKFGPPKVRCNKCDNRHVIRDTRPK